MIKDLILRKYPHRRFYDSARSSFLRLDEIAELIKAGARVPARDCYGRDIGPSFSPASSFKSKLERKATAR